MKNETVEKLKRARLARKAQSNSGIHNQIKSLQKQIVANSFSREFNIDNHRRMMKQLKILKDDLKKVGELSLTCI